MNWMRQLDNYCERIDFTYWSEPVNAVTNAAFLIAALICWRLQRQRADFGAWVLTLILAAIGIGSYLFHTHATRWALMADVLPIQIFILTYLYFATHRFLALPRWAATAALVLFFPYAYGTAYAVGSVTGPLNGSIGYIPVAILIALFGLLMLTRHASTGRGLLIGAGILAVSLFFRTIDEAICPSFPLGTHFLWHILNGTMLGWMIYVLHRHGTLVTEAPGSARPPEGRPSPS